jgi:cytochrome c-type biogenesis protein NrfE
VVAGRQVRRPLALWFATVTVTAFTIIDLLFASPFGSLDAPALRGFGLTPILEHPAMAIHPPMLYVGLACSLAAAMSVLDGTSPRAWLRATLALTTLAMALGALWSYVEQGWGGYWAWDPVENTSLLVWLAALVALHLPGRPRLALVGWAFALAGACLVRSGATPSIHGFAEQASVGWALLVVSVASIVEMVAATRGSATEPSSTSTSVPVVAGVAVLVVVAMGTLAPVLLDLFADRPAAVRGVFFSRTVGPVALVVLPFLVVRLRNRTARLAHVGALVLIVGVGATTFDREQQIGVGDGQTVRAAGLTVEGRGVTVEPGPREDVEAVVATVEIDGWVMRPSLVAYPERGGVLAETAVVTRPWRDVQVTLISANDAGFARIVVRQRPLMWAVWIGALLTTVGALSPGWRRDRRPAVEPAFEPTVR